MTRVTSDRLPNHMNRVLLNHNMKGCFNMGAVSSISACRAVALRFGQRRRHYTITSALSATSSALQSKDDVQSGKQINDKISSEKNKVISKQMQQQQQHSSYTKPKSQQFQAPFSAFISCLPGLEPLLLKEVEYLHSHWSLNNHNNASNITKEQPHILPGGVKLTVPSLYHIYLLHLYIGTASHIYVRLNDDDFDGLPPLFRARGFPELQRKVKDLIVSQRWDEWLNTLPGGKENSGLNVQVHVTTSKSKLMHTKAIEERVKQTIGEMITNIASDSTESDATSCIRLMVRIDRDVVQLSLDTSLTPLHRRGYRLKPHKAPLREDLGYALLMSGGLMPCWDLRPHSLSVGSPPPTPPSSREKKRVLLFDPFCGSGTISIEGASLQLGLPPGRFHPPPLGGTTFCNPPLWEEIKSKALSASSAKQHESISVAAGDIDAKAIDAAKANAERAGVDKYIDFAKGSFVFHPLINYQSKQQKSKEFDASQPILLVANPPYGKRLSSDEETKNNSIYKRLANVLSSSSRSIDCAIIGTDLRIMRESGMPLDVAFSTKHGGMNVVAMAGGLRKSKGL